MNYITMIPFIISTIRALEDLMPQSPGTEKFSALVSTIESVYGSIVSDQPALQKYVTGVVNLLKLLGVFKSSPKP